MLTLLILLGVEGIISKLKVDVKVGLTGSDFKSRNEHFGSNYRDPLKARPFIKLFLEALDDLMLKVLIIASVFSITFDMILAKPKDRTFGKS